MSLENERRHFSENETRKHILEVQKLLSISIRELLRRSCGHDASKLEDIEKPYFDQYTPKLKETTYGSEEYKTCLVGLKPALDHHYAVNKHHPESYPNGVKGMSLLDLLEMLCDWKAATARHADGSILKSIELNQKRFGYGDELKQILLNTLPYINVVQKSEEK